MLQCERTTGPEGLGLGALAVVPTFASTSARTAGVSEVHVRVLRSDSVTVAADTTVDVVGREDVDIELRVVLLTNPETFFIQLELREETGETLFEGTGSTTAQPAVAPTPTPLVVRYTGPGSEATAVRVTTESPEVVVGGTLELAAVALDIVGEVVPAAPIGWRSLQPSVATIPDPDVGLVAAGALPGQVPVVAELFSGAADTVLVRVVAEPAQIVLAPANVVLDGTEGEQAPVPAMVSVTNGPGDRQSLIGLEVGGITYGPGANGWLTARLSNSMAPTELLLEGTVGALAAGVYTATVDVSAERAWNNPQRVSVSFLVQPPAPVIALTPAEIAFAVTEGETDPPGQQVAVTNVGGGSSVLSGLRLGTIEYTGAGTGWLEAILNGPTAPTTVQVRPRVAGLAAGVYEATVPVTAAAAANTPRMLRVRVTVTARAPAIGLEPETVQLTVPRAGGGDPAAQPVSITNTGGGVLDRLGVGEVTYSGGATGWVTTSFNGTAAPTTVLVGARTAGIGPGTYVATVPITAVGAENSPQVLTVALQVGADPPAIALTPTQVGFAATEGEADPAAQTVAITNGGGGRLLGLGVGLVGYGAGQPQGWLTATVNTDAAPATLTLGARVTGLAAGTYTASVPVTSPTAPNSPQSVAVTFTVEAKPPVLVVTPATLGFAAAAGGLDPAAQVVTITNGGGGQLSGLVLGAVSYGPGASGWVVASLSAPSAPATVTVTPRVTGLAPGVYSATIPVSASGAQNSPQSVGVTLTVGEGAVVAATPGSVSLEGTIGSSNPPPVAVTLTNAGGSGSVLRGLAVAGVTYGPGATGWVTTALSGTEAPATLTVGATVGGVAAGTYTATVTVTAPEAANSPLAIPVTLTLARLPEIGLVPQSVSFSAIEQGENPAAAVVQVLNAGDGVLAGLSVGAIDYGEGPSEWLHATFLEGTTAPAALTVEAVVGSSENGYSQLPAGAYSASVPVVSAAAVNSPQLLNVNLTVIPGPNIGLNPETVTFTGIEFGDDPQTQTVAITNTGNGELTGLSVSILGGIEQRTDWLTASLNGEVAPTTLTLAATQLPGEALPLRSGTYTVTVEIASPDAIDGPQSVAVTFVVEPPPGPVLLHQYDDTALDASGNGNNGVVNGDPVFINGAIDRALRLIPDEGVFEDFVAVPNSVTLQPVHVSVEICFEPIRTLGGFGGTPVFVPLVVKLDPALQVGGSVDGYDLTYEHDGVGSGTAGLVFGVGGVSSRIGLKVPLQIPSETLHHVVGTYDLQEMRLYLNGNLIGARANTESIRYLGGQLNIGGNVRHEILLPESGPQFFDGAIEEVAIYDRALSGAEVADRAGRCSGAVPNLVDFVSISAEVRDFTAIGETAQYTATAYQWDEDILSGVTFEWATSDETVATVDQNGLVTAVGNGTASITATAQGVSGTVTVTATVFAGGTYNDAGGVVGTAFLFDPTHIGGASVTGPPGWNGDQPFVIGTYQPQGTAAQRSFFWQFIPPVNGEYSAATSFGSTAFAIDAGSALVTPTNLEVFGVSASAATVAWTGDPSHASYLVRISNVPETGPIREFVVAGEVRIAEMTGLNLVPGQDYQANVFAFNTDLRTPGVMPTQFNVSNGQLLFQLSAPAASVEVAPARVSFSTIGETAQLRATALDAQGSVIEGLAFTWTTSNPSAATVDPTGLTTVTGVGEATITATTQGVDGTATVFRVADGGVVPITSIETTFNYDLTSLVPAPPYASITWYALFDSTDPITGPDEIQTALYGGADGTELVQTRNDTEFIASGGGGVVYGPLQTANPIFDPMLDGVFSFGLQMNSGTANLVSFTACGNPIDSGQRACISAGPRSPASAASSSVTALVPNPGIAGNPVLFVVESRDPLGVPLQVGGHTIGAALNAASANFGNSDQFFVAPTAVDNGDGTYTVSYTPTIVGNDLLDITLDGTPIAADPLTGVAGQWQSVVIPGPAAGLRFNTEPAALTRTGDPIVPPVGVDVVDPFGNIVSGFQGDITITIAPGAGPPGAVLNGTVTRPVVAGMAFFDDLTINTAGDGYALIATASVGELAGLSAPFAMRLFGYVANSNSGSVSVIDAGTNTVVGAPIAVGAVPSGVAITPNGEFAYVQNLSDGTLSVIATATNTVVGPPILIGSPGAGEGNTAIAITPNGEFVYVQNPDFVAVIATATNAVVGAPIPVGSSPSAMAITPDGAFVYVTNSLSANVSVIATATNTVVATVGGMAIPRGLAITPDGAFVYVTNIDGVAVIATATNTVVGQRIPVPPAELRGIAFTPDGAFAYVAISDGGVGLVSVIETATNTVAGTIQIGGPGARPDRVAVTPDGAFVYVTDSGSGVVTVIATATNTVVDNIPVGAFPQGIALNVP